ncbi:hypothetical protein BDN70DRAFT_705629 [Pholiota conissans]|uniref:Uncharacterized protein n=1 Tax=Pholiota conissans TaxID=109636 RepID=A0A9P6D5Y4_9AGAR|nr:hypothetical protein BDN70DRAFT_705629 [Pholiota conissans]
MESSYPDLQMDYSFFEAQTDTSFFETHRNLFSETEYAEARKDMDKQEHYDMLSIVRTSKGKYVPLAIYQKITGDYRTVPGAVPPKPVINIPVVNSPENSVNMAKTTRKAKGKGRPAKSRQKSKKRSTSEEPSASSSAAINELINGLFYVSPHVIDRLRNSNNPKTTVNVPDGRSIATNRRVNCPAPMVSRDTNIDTARAPQEPQWDNNLYAESQQQQDFGSSSASSSSSTSTRQQQVQGPSAFESESVPWTTAKQHENKDKKGKAKQKETTPGASVGHDPEAKNGFDAPIEIYNLQDQWSGDIQSQYHRYATLQTTDSHEIPKSNSVPWTTAEHQENKDRKGKGKAKETTTSPWIENATGAKNSFDAPVETYYPEGRWRQGTQYEYHPQPQAFGSENTVESTPWIASEQRENNAWKETETTRTAWVEDLAEDEVISDAPAEEYHPQVSWQNTTQSQYEYRPQPQEIGDQDVIMHQDYPMYQEDVYNPECTPNTECAPPPKFAPIPQAAPISETPIFAAPQHTATLMPEAPHSNEPPTSFIAPTADCDVEMESVEASEPIPWTLPTWQSVREERAPAPVPVPPIIPQAFPEPSVCYEPVFIPKQQAIQAKVRIAYHVFLS